MLCTYNDDLGYCMRDSVYISDAETGEPICQDYKEGDAEC